MEKNSVTSSPRPARTPEVLQVRLTPDFDMEYEAGEQKSQPRRVSLDIAAFKRNMQVVEGELMHTKSVLDEMKKRERFHQERVAQVLEDAAQREALLLREIQQARENRSETELALEAQLKESHKDAASLREQLTRVSEKYSGVIEDSNTFIQVLDEAVHFYTSAGQERVSEAGREELHGLEAIIDACRQAHEESVRVREQVVRQSDEQNKQVATLQALVGTFKQFFYKDASGLQTENEELKRQM